MSKRLSIVIVATFCAALGVAPALRVHSVLAQTPAGAAGAPDLILTNGKIITVDDRFSIAEAVAIRGDRFVAVGTTQEISRLAAPTTRRIDLRGRAVTPGLIDNHMHIVRYSGTWQQEVRWDGIASRKQALALLAARASATPAGQWVFNLGGWAIEQFADDPHPFTRAELDKVAPVNPVLLQASYREAYLNTRALQLLGIDTNTKDAWVVRDAAGAPTGRILEAGFRQLVAKLPTLPPSERESSTLGMIRELNKDGLTAFGSAGCEADLLPTWQKLAQQGRLNARLFCITGQAASTPQQVDQALPRIGTMKLFQGNNWINDVFFGESVYGPLHDPMFIVRSDPRPEQLEQWKRMITAVAQARLPLHVHANLTPTIDAFLAQVEAVQKDYPINQLRWTFAHANQITASQLERMKALNMYVAVHPWAVINGGINREVFGDAALDMAPLRTIQNSGIMWGFGSDGSRANQIRPFVTLSWAVTGKMVGGMQALRPSDTISREDALIAFTRHNSFFVFQEDNLGSIQPGKLADLVVLDRDYLTVPVDQIKDISSVMTIVGGRVVYDANSSTPTR
jgi:predicted amidohydrolase YtcJ